MLRVEGVRCESAGLTVCKHRVGLSMYRVGTWNAGRICSIKGSDLGGWRLELSENVVIGQGICYSTKYSLFCKA